MKVLSYFRQSQNVTREKLRKALLCKKGTHKMMMKLTPEREIRRGAAAKITILNQHQNLD